MTTNYVNTSPQDPLNVNDVLRITLTAVTHWYETSAMDSQFFGVGIQNLYDNLAVLVPYQPTTNPYIVGDLAETIDFLVAGTALPTVADAVNAIINAGVGYLDVSSVQKIVGANAIPAGTPAAIDAVVGAGAQAQRLSTQAAAQAATQAAGANSWLGTLEGEFGTAGKYVIYAGAALLVYYLYTQAKAIKKII